MKAIKNAKKSKKATKGSEEAASSSAKRWSGQFSNVSTNSDGGTPLTLDGLLEHERAMENSKCTTAYGLARLRRVDPQEWTVADVGVWLDWLRMSEYRAEFIKNAVSGAELKDLDHADFTSLGITKVGHRKKLEKRIKMLQHGLDPLEEEDDDGTASHSSASSIQSSHSTTSSRVSQKSANCSSMSEGFKEKMKKDKITLKCMFKNDIALIHVPPTVEFEELGRKIKKEYGRMMTIKYKDSEGDLIRVKNTKAIRRAIKSWSGEGSLKLFLSEKKKKVSKRNADVMDTMIDGVITIDAKGKILVFNKRAEEIFGYRKKQVLKKNVSILMPPEVARDHNSYLKNYKRTKKKNIIGIGRQVTARHADGPEFKIHLSISESKVDDEMVFTATIRLIEADPPSSSKSESGPSISSDFAMFSLLDGLLDATVVIDQTGTIVFWNKAATEKLGFTKEEIVGKNVKLIMPASIGEKHDDYIKRYLATGEGRVVGIGRNVVAQKKNGEIIPVHLSLAEQQISPTRRYFTGIMRNVEEELEMKKSVLQQEREILDTLLVPSLMIDEAGKIHAFNKACSDLFGYTLLEVIGRNVSMLMPSNVGKEHDGYILNYIRTGEARILGTGRDVVALHKDGSIMAVHLSVNVKRDGLKYLFTGVFQKK